MRIESLNGRKIADIRKDPANRMPEWALVREYWTSYRNHMVANETLVEGDFVPRIEPGASPIPISIDERFAANLELRLNDQIEFNLQGIPLETKVASIRDVQWEKLERNSFVIFPEGALEDAPQFSFMAFKASESEAKNLRRALASRYANITVVDARSLVQSVEKILAQIGVAVRALCALVVLTSMLVLIATVISSNQLRSHEVGLLKTLGASRSLVSLSIVSEYAVIGTVAALLSTLLAFLGQVLLTKYLFKQVYYGSSSLLIVAVACPLIAALIALLLARRLYGKTAMLVARS